MGNGEGLGTSFCRMGRAYRDVDGEEVASLAQGRGYLSVFGFQFYMLGDPEGLLNRPQPKPKVSGGSRVSLEFSSLSFPLFPSLPSSFPLPFSSFSLFSFPFF